MSWLEIVSLILAGAAAGAINAVAGGGTLLTFPVLLFFGTSPMIANATSTTSRRACGFVMRRKCADIKPGKIIKLRVEDTHSRRQQEALLDERDHAMRG
jgi:uncharacterized membrane protein YfcA